MNSVAVRRETKWRRLWKGFCQYGIASQRERGDEKSSARTLGLGKRSIVGAMSPTLCIWETSLPEGCLARGPSRVVWSRPVQSSCCEPEGEFVLRRGVVILSGWSGVQWQRKEGLLGLLCGERVVDEVKSVFVFQK